MQDSIALIIANNLTAPLDSFEPNEIVLNS
jgi:hypothetical protein